MNLIKEFVSFKFYRMPPDPVNCLVEERGSNSGSGDQGISHLQWNIQHLKFMEDLLKNHQNIEFSGTGASHKNLAAERAINMVVTMESTIMM